MRTKSDEIIAEILNDIAGIGAAITENVDYDLTDDDLRNFKTFYHALPEDPYGSGARRRVYARLRWPVGTARYYRAEDQRYSQTYNANDMNGGEVREFEGVPNSVLENGPLGNIVARQLAMLSDLFEFAVPVLTIGLHLVRYEAEKGVPTYSSPIFFHRDDEPVVLLTVVDKSANLVGGDTLLARNKRSIDRSVSLGELETAILTKATKHMVTPMESSEASDPAWRDIILLTVEEADETVRLKSVLH